MRGQTQDFLQLCHACVVGMNARPYTAQAHGMRCKQQVFGGSRHIVYPEIGLAFDGFCEVSAGNKCAGGLVAATGVGHLRTDAVEYVLVGDDHKCPGLLVDGGGGCHSTAEQGLDLFL